MKKTPLRLVICCILIAAVLAVIWSNSLMTGESSGRLSKMVGQFLSILLPFFDPESATWHHLLRKLAHFSEFAALGLCLSWLYGMLMERKWLMLALPLISGATAAAIDETIQLFTPNRYGSIVDVCIDSSGVLAGIVVLHLLWLLSRKIFKK